ncbi:hypothetical protein [Aestuariivivens sediminis]|uniref:hypothetical protein n=1 Tax=Aestuariivivens sediminis TaxID=2913557 RepID=UPI001F575BB8|nr:hypothetical protein [Aestuariivivens sediminis]
MLRKFLVTAFIFTVSCIGMAQKDYQFIGGIQLNDSLTITYKLDISEINGEVKGYSITDLGGTYETKSSVFGEYDEEKKELSFRETQTIYTKTKLEPDYEFCYINTTLKNFSLGKTKEAKAKFMGLFADNTPCINGDLFISSAEKIQAKMMKVTERINKMKRIPDSVKQRFKPLKMLDSLNMNILKENEVLSLFSKRNRITFSIHDGGKEDGDRISIFANGRPILSNYEAKNTKQVLMVDLLDNKTEIIIKALNEGTIAPNTVVVEIEDGTNSIKALSNLKKDESTQIDILKVKM